MKLRHISAALLALPLLLAGCGGSDENQPSAQVASVYVFGDSLQDVGTFGGVKATINGPDTQLYVERVAQTYGVNGMCNHYIPVSATPTFGPNPKPGCTNYAIGGGRINFTVNSGGAVVANNASEFSVQKQLTDAASARTYAANDLLIVDGGGNDSADLVTNYLAAATDGGVKFGTMVATLGITPDPANPAATGAAYMTALANQFHASLKANALDKGAQRVVIINIPGILNTPRFKLVLASIAQQAGQAQADQARALFDGWIQVFNARLATLTAGDSRIALVDLYTEFNNQVANPAQFKLTNVTTPACPITGQGSDGLPTYDFATCTSAALSASIPSGETSADWWKSYAFADGFHPTPYGHQLVSQLISRSLARAGWL